MFRPERISLQEVGRPAPDRFQLTSELAFVRPSDGTTYEVDHPFATDLASVPRTLTWLIPRYGIYTKAAVLHDAMCQHNIKVVDRFEADEIFREGMRVLDVPKIRIWLMWAAVTWATASLKLLIKVRDLELPALSRLRLSVVPTPATLISAVLLGNGVFLARRWGWLDPLVRRPVPGAVAGWYVLAAVITAWVLATVAVVVRTRRVSEKLAGCWAITVPALPLLAGGVVVGGLLAVYLPIERAFLGEARQVRRADPDLRQERLAYGVDDLTLPPASEPREAAAGEP